MYQSLASFDQRQRIEGFVAEFSLWDFEELESLMNKLTQQRSSLRRGFCCSFAQVYNYAACFPNAALNSQALRPSK